MTEFIIIQEYKNNNWKDIKKFETQKGFEAQKEFDDKSENSENKMRLIKREIVDDSFLRGL